MENLPDIVTIREEWTQLLDQKREYRDTIVNDDLYSTIEYLGFLDRFSKWLLLNSRELEKWNNPKDKVRTLEVNELKTTVDQKFQSIQDEYAVLAENTLRRCEDIVARYTDGTQRKKDNRGMDKDLVLQEMKDSLEDYRVAREEYVTALDIPYKRAAPDKSSLEDVGEEAPELDSILSQLDTIITSCDYALILNDVEE
jgi:hypothetical protein